MASESNGSGRLLQVGARLFPRVEEDQRFVQRLVGLVGGIGTILVGLVNWTIFGPELGMGPLRSFFSSYVGLIVVMGLINLGCGFWNSPVARSLHILLFVFSGIFGALSANRGNITSGFFIVFAMVVLLEYKVNRKVAWFLGVIMLFGYVAALAVGYRDDVTHPLISALSSMITLLTFVGLFVGIVARHRIVEARHAEILEQSIAERTTELHAALEERSIMLQEIHHRVKNNMQTISTVLGMETDRLPESTARDALISSSNRIQAMSQVHDALYASGSIDSVNLENYTEDLVRALLQTTPYHVTLELDLPDSANVPLSFASSFGLVVNELVSNAARHAFSDGLEAMLTVTVAADPKGVELRVADNGRGLPDDFDLAGDVGVGMTIVKSVVEHLGGRITFTSDGGTEWRVYLPLGAER